MQTKVKLALMAAALFVFAGGGAQTAYAAQPKDACSLLTSAQVSAALGFSAKPGHPGVNDTTTCVWPLSSFTKIGSKDTKLVQVTIMDSTDWAKIAPLVSAMGSVQGVGDAAVYGPGLFQLYVKKGDNQFLMLVQGFPPDQVKAKERALALDALAKL